VVNCAVRLNVESDIDSVHTLSSPASPATATMTASFSDTRGIWPSLGTYAAPDGGD
jgi:hypothetical protein